MKPRHNLSDISDQYLTVKDEPPLCCFKCDGEVEVVINNEMIIGIMFKCKDKDCGTIFL